MYAIMTVAGADSTGIIAKVTTKLAEHNVNIVDVSQTLMSGYFTMVLRVEFDENKETITDLQKAMGPVAEETNQVIRIQSEALFTAMNEV
ncbi:ACT domain-containing protein [uncultured Corynebacterium sp.]|uniref:ACT domain-containing protein n=1 Tax=uncultured Corynebacterium sp. TaxID=159447 RepID=UPI0025D9B48D|nr:ACT domain-containing protein [uncultured Corynebacterium sp.]